LYCVCCTVRTKGRSQDNQDKEVRIERVQTERKKKKVPVLAYFLNFAEVGLVVVQGG
jgi:hypothetical protein